MSGDAIMWVVWSACAVADVFVVIYFIRTMRWKTAGR